MLRIAKVAKYILESDNLAPQPSGLKSVKVDPH